MKDRHLKIKITTLAIGILLTVSLFGQIPTLQKRGSATQLIVDGKPWLIHGGELGNSTASDINEMRTIWPKMKKLNINTILAPVYWELIEPEENKFNFATVDSLLNQARQNDIKLVLLWFGAWKNSMSCYAPMWVKKDTKRFPRSKTADGKPVEILTPFSKSNLEADQKAFNALMTHLSKTDAQNRTVIMIQVENEIGMIPDARDYCDNANQLFKQQVPPQFINTIKLKQKTLQPHLLKMWKENGEKVQGNWEDIFGKSLYTDELFMAWYFAEYVEQIAASGKKIYPLPMYLNAALDSRGRVPGKYPSAGPLAKLMDIWQTAAPSIDLLAPDIYDPGFDKWIAPYQTASNPLFIPEIRNEKENAARVFYAFGKHDAMGFSPFSIEDCDENHPIGKSYKLLQQLMPIMIEHQGNKTTEGVWFTNDMRKDTIQLNGYQLNVSHDYTLGWDAAAKDGSLWPETGGIVIATAPDEFIVGGTGIVITFEAANSNKEIAGIGLIEEIENKNGEWITKRIMNGDQNHQGRHLRIPVGVWNIQRIKLYKY